MKYCARDFGFPQALRPSQYCPSVARIKAIFLTTLPAGSLCPWHCCLARTPELLPAPPQTAAPMRYPGPLSLLLRKFTGNAASIRLPPTPPHAHVHTSLPFSCSCPCLSTAVYSPGTSLCKRPGVNSELPDPRVKTSCSTSWTQ